MDQLTNGWPVAVDELALFGHSMGGLVVRSGCHYGECEGMSWTHKVRHVFCLGSPHLGAPLEKAVGLATFGLAMLPETRPFARFLNIRSVGIKDLRFGSVVDEDWAGRDLDTYLRDACVETPFLQNATYYFVAATLTPDRNHPISLAFGDLLVRYPSASGHGHRRRLPFGIDHGRHVGGLNHFSLLNHPTVYASIREWLTAPPPAGVAITAEASAATVEASATPTAELTQR
jgi:pimeloyl-ACP methyl ester carboxylesterase